MLIEDSGPSKNPRKPRTATRQRKPETIVREHPATTNNYIMKTLRCPRCKISTTFLVWADEASCLDCYTDFRIQIDIKFL